MLYGSDAIGGAINIVTRRPPSRGTTASADLLVGSHNRIDATVDLGQRRGSVGAGLTAGRRSVALAPGIAGNIGTFAHRWDIAPRMEWAINDAVSLDASALVVDESQRYRTGTLYTFSDNSQIDAHLSAALTAGAHRWTPTISLSRFTHLSRAST